MSPIIMKCIILCNTASFQMRQTKKNWTEMATIMHNKYSFRWKDDWNWPRPDKGGTDTFDIWSPVRPSTKKCLQSIEIQYTVYWDEYAHTMLSVLWMQYGWDPTRTPNPLALCCQSRRTKTLQNTPRAFMYLLSFGNANAYMYTWIIRAPNRPGDRKIAADASHAQCNSPQLNTEPSS